MLQNYYCVCFHFVFIGKDRVKTFFPAVVSTFRIPKRKKEIALVEIVLYVNVTQTKQALK